MGAHLRRSHRIAAAATCLLTVAVAFGIAQAGPAQAAGDRVVPGSVAPAVSSGTATGDVAGTRDLTVQFWLRPDVSAAQAYANAVSDPHSPLFHHYLSPDQYTARFGPGTAATDSVASWLRQQGFTDVTVDAQREYVRANATVATIQNALHVRMRTYRIAGSATPVTANDRAVTLPGDIAGDVIGVSGLDSAPVAQDISATTPNAADNCSHYYGQNVQKGLPPLAGRTTFPTHVCGYTGSQVRTAYGMNDASTGNGVTVAYVEWGLPYAMFQTLSRWAAANGLPAPKAADYHEVALGSGNRCGNPFDTEEQLDIEAGYAMAPDQRQIVVGGDSCQTGQSVQALFDADIAVLDGNGSRPLASIAANSWDLPGSRALPAEYVTMAHAFLLRAAGEGVGMYYSSGDSPGVSIPASDPYATAVGGTTVAIGADNQRGFETGWSNFVRGIDPKTNGYTQGVVAGAAGGGVSPLWSQPWYQKGVVPSSMSTPPAGDRKTPSRTVPDISALADATTGFSAAETEPGSNGAPATYQTYTAAGTSLSAPLVAGMVAAAEQGRPTPFGFINPLLYSLTGTSAVRDVLPVTSATPARYRDIYCPAKTCDGPGGNAGATVRSFDSQAKDFTDQVTAPGYDTMTGIGTPNGQSFITALRRRAG